MIWAPLVTTLGALADKLIPDKDLAEKFKHELEVRGQAGEFDLMIEQIRTNREEARHESLFVSGWRPYIGWVCGMAFAYHFLLYPILVAVAALTGFDVSVLPEFELETLITVLLGMLGLGGLRTFEKYQGVNKWR